MDKEQLPDWRALEKQALESLDIGYKLENRRAIRLFQFIVVPTFHPAISFEVFRSMDRDASSAFSSYFAAHTKWMRDIDIEKFRTPIERLKHPRILSPTLQIGLSDLDDSATELALIRLKSISISAWTEFRRGMTIDGTHIELIFGSLPFGVRYSCMEPEPIEWRPLFDVARDLLKRTEASK